MRLILEVISGSLVGRKIEAKPGEVVRIGRTTKADIATEDGFMSGEHFAIECKNRICRVRDLNSRNGTQVNGETISEAVLRDGDRIHAGRTDFTVRIEDALKTVEISPSEQESLAKAPREVESRARRPQSQKAVKEVGPEPGYERVPPREKEIDRRAVPQPQEPGLVPSPVDAGSVPSMRVTAKEPTPAVDVAPEPVVAQPLPTPVPEPGPRTPLESYEAATPEGRLIEILSHQPGNLMALMDAARDEKLLELLGATTEEYQSLYRSEQKTKLAPYLVRLPPRSDLLKQMVEQGWGREWGVYLTCPLSLSELRDYFRSSLMVTMPDGMELFSRFYDPKFFRAFLESCTAAEAEKFFGPITSYFMEDERRGILLQFKRGRKGAEKKGHLLSVLG